MGVDGVEEHYTWERWVAMLEEVYLLALDGFQRTQLTGENI